MSFGFQFDESEMDEEYLSSDPQQPFTSSSTSARSPSIEQAPFTFHLLDDMLQNLPSRISYSSIHVTLPSRDGSDRTQRLLRRDVFDARFQMLVDEDEEEQEIEAAAVPGASSGAVTATQVSVDAESDLIPGVYEGGLKTWECALDLVETIDALQASCNDRDCSRLWSDCYDGKEVLELGCGTAIPSLYIFSQILKEAPSPKFLTLHLADYNAQVLQLVTLPNLILTWYDSPAALEFRHHTHAVQLAHERQELLSRGQDHFDTSAALLNDIGDQGELSITEELLKAFKSCLIERHMQFAFYSGAWSKFPPSLTTLKAPGRRKIDMILTSETIYSLESLPALVELLDKYANPEGSTGAAKVLVAAKVIYFGVGGGVEPFKQTLAQLAPSAKVEPIHSVTKGVGRTVLSVTF
ncbi:related to HPM1 - AdoMet-dependent methyltransferase [Melanopsichium pennsylvanicum]|uniref:protein-histidine N-methyltransferase n=2 Tax=Melanopsichium pennsylvanicum TaxID=63383 RepID=A0AAJ4XS39_9BASI|nr:conserved hypothetical protein [Melanopsichium pennsylvanicum 4]SNX87303.1 related to HPM1 - AdoMet-dependent methyltransferase [Melanopsichium pennsylvanicum]